ncbi:MAG: CdaR family protein [Clostridiales bacterium]|nr:CdaR family protein [Clostridiales bacterium]
MKKFFNSNLFYALLAVVMAVFLMFFIESSENPITERSYNHVGVTVTGLAENYLLENDPGAVEIRVSGYRSAYNLILARDVRAYVDLRDVKPGTSQYPVQYSLPSGLSVVYIRPESVELSVDVMGSITMPIVCVTHNAVREGYSYRDPVLSPSSITLSGPQRILDQITEASVSVNLSERTTPYTADLPIELLDLDGAALQSSRISMSADRTNVRVDIAENLSSKSVTVRTALSGSVDDRYIVTGVEVRPSAVKINGTYSAISTIEYLTTEPIDLSPMTETFQGFVRLVTTPDIDVLEGDMVELTVRIEKNLTRRLIERIPIEIHNAPEGRNYGTIPLTVNALVAAYANVFEESTIDGELQIDILAYVDLEGEPADARDYPLTVVAGEDIEIVQVSEETVRLFHNEV